MHIYTSYLGERRMVWGGVRQGPVLREVRWKPLQGRSNTRSSHAMPANKQLQRTVRHKVPRRVRQRAAAELRRYAA